MKNQKPGKSFMGITNAVVLFVFLTVTAIAQQKPISSKVSSDLFNLTKSSKMQAQTGLLKSIAIPGIEAYSGHIQIRDGNYVVIDAIIKENGKKLIEELEAIGLKDATQYAGVVSGLLPIGSIELLENVQYLKFAAPAYAPVTNIGEAYSLGDVAMRSDTVRNKLGIDGSGVTIGVLSDSYNDLGGATVGVAGGDLPGVDNPNGYTDTVIVLSDLGGGGSDEGRGMAEIIHDVAPGAKIAFHTAFNGIADFAQGIIDLAELGCQVITDDVSYFAEPMFQDGPIAQAVDESVNKYGVSFFSSAGNSDRESYQSNYRPGDTTDIKYIFDGSSLGKYSLHDFDESESVDYFQTIVLLPGEVTIYSVQWSTPYASACEGCPGAETDLDVFILLAKDPSTAVLPYQNANVGNDPVEIMGVSNSGSDTLLVYLAIGKPLNTPDPLPNPKVVKYINFRGTDIFEYATYSSTCFGHSNSSRVTSVGAVAYFNTPEFGDDPPIINGFSSYGSTPIYYKKNGKKYWKPVIRRNPDFTAPDGGNTSFFGFPINDGDNFPNFFGTSAAAPHAAAVSALLTEISNGKVPQFVNTICMAASAIDMDDPFTPEFDYGYDYKTGYGLIQANEAADKMIKIVGIKPISVYSECSDNPDSARNWRIYNPNPFNVEVNWDIMCNDQSGKMIVEPGDNYFSTLTAPYHNMLVVKWLNAYDWMMKACAYSYGYDCHMFKSTYANSVMDINDINFTLVNRVYPNPFVDNISVEIYSGESTTIIASIYNIQGKNILTRNISLNEGLNTSTIDAAALPKGIYMMKVYSDNGTLLESFKLVK